MTCTLLLRSAWFLRHSTQKRQYSSVTWTRDAFVRQCLFTLHKQTHEPLWRFLAVLGHPRVDEAVRKAYIPEGYKRLALALPSLNSTTATRDNRDDTQNTLNIEDILSALHLSQQQLDTLKTWIHVYSLFANYSHSPSCTLTRIVDPLFASLNGLQAHHQAPLLIFGAAHLSTWNLVLPLEKVVQEFVSLSHPIETPIYSSKSRAQTPNLDPGLSTHLPNQPNGNPRALHDPAGARRIILTLPDTPTRPTSELYLNLFLRALALAPKYSTAYDRYVRQVLHRMDTLPRFTAKRPIATLTGNGNETGVVNPDQTGVVSKGAKEVEDTVQLRYTLHPDTYTCLLLSTHNALSTPGRVPHQASLLSPPLATFLASRLLKEPGLEMGDSHREALLRFWAKEAMQGGARGERGKVHARELWLEAQAKGGTVPEEVQDTLGLLSHPSKHGDGTLTTTEGIAGTKVEVERDPVLRANTLYLGSQTSVRGVRELLNIFNSASPHSPSSARHPSHSHLAVLGPQQQLKVKPAVDVYDLTSTLSSAANDASVSLSLFQATFMKLMRAYKASSASTQEGKGRGAVAGTVPLAAHTAYLKGLYWRNAFEDARVWWDAEVWEKSVQWNASARSPPKNLYVLDKKAITVGVQVLARCGRSKEAVELLQRVAWKPVGPSAGLSTTPPALSASTPTLHSALNPSLGAVLQASSPAAPSLRPKSIALSSISLLDIFVAFRRAARPDVVFSLWEHMYTLYGVMPTSEVLNVLLQSARMAVVMESNSLKAHVRGAINMGRERMKFGSRTSGMLGQQGESEGESQRALEEVLDVASRTQYEGGRLWRGKRVEDAAREVFMQVLFGMEVGYGTPVSSSQGSGDTSRDKKVGLANVLAPACSVRSDWDSDAGVVGLGVRLPELRLRRFGYKPGPEMFAWVPAPAPTLGQGETDPVSQISPPKLVPRPLYPSLSLTNTNFLAYLSLLAVTRRTSEVALTLAWMRELGINPSESVLALACVLWEEVSVEGPLVDLVVTRLSGKGGKSKNEKRPEPRDEYERLVFWIEDWVGQERVPGIEVLRKWRGVVRDMREPGVRAALVKQRKGLKEEQRQEKLRERKRLQRIEARVAERRWGGGI